MKERFSLSGSVDFFIPEPCVETDDFTMEERKRAYALAILETDAYVITPRGLQRILRAMFKYKLHGPTLRSLLRQPRCILRYMRRFGRAGLLGAYARRYLSEDFLGGRLHVLRR